MEAITLRILYNSSELIDKTIDLLMSELWDIIEYTVYRNRIIMNLHWIRL